MHIDKTRFDNLGNAKLMVEHGGTINIYSKYYRKKLLLFSKNVWGLQHP